jgi:predicted O-linked N-acetylglucosamine transferase (SPINDLY family)
VDIRGESNASAANRILADEVDILVDLTGYTENTRSAILALRPAPVQVNYLGYPGTMGAPFVDYLIADPFIIPSSQRHCYTEKVTWLPDCYLPNDRSRPRLAAPSRTGLRITGTRCCFLLFQSNIQDFPGDLSCLVPSLDGSSG